MSDTITPTKSAHTSLKRARILFSNCSGIPKSTLLVPRVDESLHNRALARKRMLLYPDTAGRRLDVHDKKYSSALVAVSNDNTGSGGIVTKSDRVGNGDGSSKDTGAIVIAKNAKHGRASVKIPTPKWHAPWRLSTVISAHLGWVRSIAFDPTNDMFATGGADNVIKIFDTAKACVGADDALKLTLTGHISPVRGLAFSERHPYLFSAGEDKMVKVGLFSCRLDLL